MRYAFLVLLFSLTAHAAPAADSWQKLLDQATASNLTDQNGTGEYHSLQRLSSADPAASRTAEYFSVVGHTQGNGVFARHHVEIVSEAWTVGSDKVSHVDQWGFVVNLQGALTAAMHRECSENEEGVELSESREDFNDLTDSALLSRFQTKLAEWEAAPAASRTFGH